MRHAARVDDNHPAIRAGLRQIPGITVADTSAVGNGFPDLVVGGKCQCGRPTNYLAEIKDPGKPPSARWLTPRQAEFHAGWRGQIQVVYTMDDALRMIGVRT